MKIINTNIEPSIPWDWMTVEDNATYGKVDVSKLRLYIPKGKTLEEVKEEVKGMKPANWAVLQYLFKHPNAVPEDWLKYYLFFFGTSLRDRGGDWYVPFARWASSVWKRDARWLRRDWDSASRVVLLDDSGTLDSAPFDPGLVARVEILRRLCKTPRLYWHKLEPCRKLGRPDAGGQKLRWLTSWRMKSLQQQLQESAREEMENSIAVDFDGDRVRERTRRNLYKTLDQIIASTIEEVRKAVVPKETEMSLSYINNGWMLLSEIERHFTELTSEQKNKLMDYERNHSHSHCWNQGKSPACGQSLASHKQCCLCDRSYNP